MEQQEIDSSMLVRRLAKHVSVFDGVSASLYVGYVSLSELLIARPPFLGDNQESQKDFSPVGCL